MSPQWMISLSLDTLLRSSQQLLEHQHLHHSASSKTLRKAADILGALADLAQKTFALGELSPSNVLEPDWTGRTHPTPHFQKCLIFKHNLSHPTFIAFHNF